MTEKTHEKSIKEGSSAQETLNFEAQVPQLLRLLADSIYSNPEIFLRELISNASDAIDKARYESLANKEAYKKEAHQEAKIKVTFDKDKKTITISDTGIGMNKQELIDNLGTIARSGTQDFINKLSEAKSKQESMNLIGQFGVGFYSSFVVADKVTVRTRRAGHSPSEGFCWESAGEGSYTLTPIQKENYGTDITLHLKADKEEFLDEYRLRTIIKHYSDHISVPIVMMVKEAPSEEESNSADDKKPAVMKEEVINQAKALWTQRKSDITEEQYIEFYKHISHAFEGPLGWAHNHVEGKLSYISLLYVPKHAPFDLMHPDASHGLKLYVQRVFIMDKAAQLMPRYLRFVQGVVDSNDLPLNISREILQVNAVVDKIKSGCVTRVLGLLEAMAEKKQDKYKDFWKAFGAVLKEGIGEDYANKDRIAKLLRFSSTHSDSPEQTVSLDDYISRMKDKQDKIYYITAEGFAAAKNSPHLEAFRKRGIEVLLLSDRVDEWMTAHLTEYEGKPLQSVAKGRVDFSDDEVSKEEKEKQKQAEDEFAGVVKHFKDVLGDNIKDVRLTDRLTDSPACLVADEADMGGNLQRLLRSAGQPVPTFKPILELNPTHPILGRLKDEQDDDRFKEWVHVLFDQALLAEGGQLEDPATFVKRLNKLML